MNSIKLLTLAQKKYFLYTSFNTNFILNFCVIQERFFDSKHLLEQLSESPDSYLAY